MNPDYKNQLKALREKVPVGIIHGLSLLEKTQGDIKAAATLYMQDAVSIVRIETASSAEIAEKYLSLHNYDTALAIKNIRNDRQAEMILPKNKIPFKIMNTLLNGKASRKYLTGPVGVKVSPTGNSPLNHAWISIKANERVDFSSGSGNYVFDNFEVEYLEMNEAYNSDWDDNDHHLVKREIYYNIKTEAALEELLVKWLDDFSTLTHIHNTGYPY